MNHKNENVLIILLMCVGILIMSFIAYDVYILAEDAYRPTSHEPLNYNMTAMGECNFTTMPTTGSDWTMYFVCDDGSILTLHADDTWDRGNPSNYSDISNYTLDDDDVYSIMVGMNGTIYYNSINVTSEQKMILKWSE